MKLDAERFQEINKKNLLYQGGVLLAPGNYRLKFVARENESGKIGTFEAKSYGAGVAAGKNDSQFGCPFEPAGACQKTAEVQTKTQGLHNKTTSSPLEMNGETIVPSVTRLFTQNQTLYVFFQAYYPEKDEKKEAFDGNSLRAGLVFFRNGLQVNATPLLSPAAVDAKRSVASFRISLPLANCRAAATRCRRSRSRRERNILPLVERISPCSRLDPQRIPPAPLRLRLRLRGFNRAHLKSNK